MIWAHTLAAPRFSMAAILCPTWYEIDINSAQTSVVPALFNVPRRSSSRSDTVLMKEYEWLIKSVVNLMVALFLRWSYSVCNLACALLRSGVDEAGVVNKSRS